MCLCHKSLCVQNGVRHVCRVDMWGGYTVVGSLLTARLAWGVKTRAGKTDVTWRKLGPATSQRFIRTPTQIQSKQQYCRLPVTVSRNSRWCASRDSLCRRHRAVHTTAVLTNLQSRNDDHVTEAPFGQGGAPNLAAATALWYGHEIVVSDWRVCVVGHEIAVSDWRVCVVGYEIVVSNW
jgi:hypothetical protein